jgi:polar amino acid transport system substrate-binding protein
MSWTDALKAAETGKVDGVIGASKKEATNLLTGTESVAEPKYALFVRRESTWKYESVRSLSAIRLGAIKGYNYWSSLDSYIEKSSPSALKLYTGDAPMVEAMADLTSGKIDVMVESVLVFYWAAKTTGRSPKDFRMAYSEISDPLYVAFSPTEQGRKYAKLFDLGLHALKDQGRVAAILEKYGLENK